jgi:DNA-binding NtrC family response regulator
MSSKFGESPPNPHEAVTVLLVSSDPDDRVSFRSIFGLSNWRLCEAATCGEAVRLAAWTQIPVVVCEQSLPDGDWDILLERLAALPLRPNVVVTSRLADDRLWADVLSLGGYDVLAQPLDASEVLRVAFLAWQEWSGRRETGAPAKTTASAGRPRAGRSAA